MGGNVVARIRRDSDDDGVAFANDAAAVTRAATTAARDVRSLREPGARAFEAEGNDLAGLEGSVEDSGEGRGRRQDAIDHGVAAPALRPALDSRGCSRGQGDQGARVLAALPDQFGAHAVKKCGA